MTDGKIEISTEINSEDTEKQLNNLTSKLNTFSSKITNSFKNGKVSAMALGVAVAGIVASFKALTAVVKDTTALYKIQANAERSLETAVRNNPYMDNTAITRLKDYASAMQNIGTVGDESLLPMMSKLVASGRSVGEVEKIISTALDVSASGAMSLEEAVSSLNRTYEGQIGRIGTLASGLTSLTAEELKEGKAVDVVSKAYKGQMKETTALTGGTQQLANAWGDFKEIIGEGFNAILNPITTKIAKIVSAINGVLGAYKALDANASEDEKDQRIIDTSQKEYDKQTALASNYEQKRLEAKQKADDKYASITKNGKKQLSESERKYYEENYLSAVAYYEKLKQQAEENAERSKQDITDAEYRIQKRKDEVIQIQEGQKAQDEYNTKVNTQKSIIDANTEALNAELEKIEAKYAVMESEGQQIDENAKAQEILNAKEQAYIDLITTDTSLIDANSDIAVKRIDDIIEEYKKLAKQVDDTETEMNKFDLSNFLSTLNNCINELSSTLSTVSSLTTSNASALAEVQTAEVAKLYAEGKISAEEYAEAIEEIEEEQAEKEYQVEMWQWSAQIVQATAAQALAMVQALTESGTTAQKLLNMALIGTTASAQIASLVASKPIPPQFATGGIVGGTSYTGDKVQAMLNSREMVLNLGQQKNLFDAINGGAMGNINQPVSIYNNRGGDTNVKADVSMSGISVYIDKRVNQSMAKGAYNKSLVQAQTSLKGINLTN